MLKAQGLLRRPVRISCASSMISWILAKRSLLISRLSCERRSKITNLKLTLPYFRSAGQSKTQWNWYTSRNVLVNLQVNNICLSEMLGKLSVYRYLHVDLGYLSEIRDSDEIFPIPLLQ